jgi:cysteine desulfurase / selenocysteine lyase
VLRVTTVNSHIPTCRADFPIFSAKPDWAYLDSAATSHLPQQVLDRIAEYQCGYYAPVHRGLYREAVRATDEYERARATIAKLIGAHDSHEIIFTAGATASSNMLVYALEHSIVWQPGDEVVVSIMEHHTSLVPLQELARRKGLVIKYIPLSEGFVLNYDIAEALITERTRLVSVMLASNVLGTINDIVRIAARAHAVGALMVSDATAAVGHIPVSVGALGVDCLYFSGHKMCGPTGIGVLYATSALLAWLNPSFFGGGMVSNVTQDHATWVEGPAKFEAGTPNSMGAIGLGAAAEYLLAHEVSEIARYVSTLVTLTRETLAQSDGVRLYAAEVERNVGVVSFSVEGIHPHDLAEIAARHNVAIRAGHHCAIPLHAALGAHATARASMYLYTTKADIDALGASIRHARTLFGRL